MKRRNYAGDAGNRQWGIRVGPPQVSPSHGGCMLCILAYIPWLIAMAGRAIIAGMAALSRGGMTW